MLCERIIRRAREKLRCQVFEFVTVQHIFIHWGIRVELLMPTLTYVDFILNCTDLTLHSFAYQGYLLYHVQLALLS